MASSALKEWSAHYNAIAQDRQLSSSVLTERMPSIDSLQEIRQHQQKIFVCLEQLTRIISEADQQKGRATVEQRSQELNGQPRDYEEDTPMNHVEEPKSNSFTSEAKKRRGVSFHVITRYSLYLVESLLIIIILESCSSRKVS